MVIIIHQLLLIRTWVIKLTEKLNLEDLKRRMEGAISAFSHDLAGLRTGRASVNMIDQITVDAYGSKMPIEQVGTISVPEPRTISIQVWDKGLVVSVEKSIQESGLGLNPQTDGQLVRIPVPELNEERRQELIKIAGKYAEQSRVSIRNIRRDGMDSIKSMEKNSEIGKDESVSLASNVQDLTDEHIKKIDETLLNKEQEIKQV
jgi:ribosome recycling factor